MPDWNKYITVKNNGQGKLTYTRCRGYHHWTCIKCHRRERERIPDQADDTYRHNPGNPVMAVCDKCNHGIGTGRIRLKPKRPKHQAPKESRDINEPYRQYDNGYDSLDGEWLNYYGVATKFCHKAQTQDKDDLLHTIILNLAVAGKNNDHKPNNPSWMYRIASFTVTQYWRDYYKQVNGIDCGHCSNQQRKKCKAEDLYSDCPKAIRIESLSKPIIGDDGETSELGKLIADNKALDLADWLDIKTFLLGCPQRLIDIAEKIRQGQALNGTDRKYLCKWRKRYQKTLI